MCTHLSLMVDVAVNSLNSHGRRNVAGMRPNAGAMGGLADGENNERTRVDAV
ncbi:hypothetical protein SPMU_03520 [Sphingomonas mucosissima]|uniref:Uncharacterized protein n=1 Tax=Sphingomonas mucosissima TaxID=370959 RepID=A0A245ZQN3_9SPHN|nr:hypothetical protein SPMU_03520 [Sphingomonas mucosissima]